MGAQAAAALARAAAGGVLGTPPPGAGLPLVGGVDLDALPRPYDLHRVALSHGGAGLPPTAYDAGARALHRVLAGGDGGPVTVTVTAAGPDRLRATWGREGVDPAAVVGPLRRLLGLDVVLDELAKAARDAADALPAVAAAVDAGGGRLLAPPTVWEALVTGLLSTRSSWSATRAAVGRLVAAADGTAPATGPHGERAFPAPEAVAARDEAWLGAHVRAGYRTPALLALARAVAGGRVDPERWRDPAVDDGEVAEAVRALPGFGAFSADTVLGLLGRPRGLALDGWARRALAGRLGVDVEAVTPALVAERYAPLGRWAGTGLGVELSTAWLPVPDRAGSTCHHR